MASVFKRTRKKPIPAGAEIVKRRGKRFATWKSRGRKRRAELVADGASLIVEDPNYTVTWYTWEGKRQTTSGGPDRDAAEALGAKLEAEEMQRRRGLIDPRQEKAAAEGRRPLEEHLGDYEAKLRTANRSDDYVARTLGFTRKICEAGGFATIADITPDGVHAYAAELCKIRSARTVYAHLTAIKGFSRWLWKQGKLPADPLVLVQKPNPETDRRRERRMLLPEEWEWLRSVTLAGNAERFGMASGERVLLYATAVQTGLRSGELRSLTRGQLFLNSNPPFVTCKAGSTKNKKEARQYVQPELADELRAHAATKAPAAPVFIMPRREDVAKMLRGDLAAARREWLNSVRHDPGEFARRQESDFLTPVNHHGENLDFHSLRHTCGVWLAMSGAHPKAVQTVMRHSTITLTMDTYGHLFPGQEAETVARLPRMLGDDPEALRATGTADAAASLGQHLGQQSNGKSRLRVAASGEKVGDGESAEPTGGPESQVPTLARNNESRQALAAAGEGGREGIQTLTWESPNGIHHPVYGVKMKEKADRLGHECHLLIPGISKSEKYADATEFLMDKLLAP